ncbi:MAG: DUF3365 domain-containing protein [Pirellulales bacterium]
MATSIETEVIETETSRLSKLLHIRWNDRYALSIFTILFLGIIAMALWSVSRSSSRMIEKTTLNDAAIYTYALTEFRKSYTSEVVTAAKANGMKVSHDYQNYSNGIPWPATLSMLLGNRIHKHASGGSARLYSDYPFPWREEGGPNNQFERDALTQLRANPDKPYYSFDEVAGQPVLHYAIADTMRTSCIKCHNNHPKSPKTDWKVGDVRGVVEVTFPLTLATEAAAEHAQITIIGILALALMGLIGLVGLLNIQKHHP